jgi:CheY-like chemotaxis protein
MQLRSNRLQSSGGAVALFRGRALRAAATASFSATTADALAFLSGNTRYRDRYLPSVDPVRVLIVAKFAECAGIAALVHSIGRFATRITCSADAALKVAGEFLPDVVLLTTELPDLASYRVAAALRWGSGHAAPRLIAMTDDILAGDHNRALAAGFEQYLTPPVQRAALESVLRHRRTVRLQLGRGARNPGN